MSEASVTQEVEIPDDLYRLAIAKSKCESDHLFFTRYFFKARQGIKFKVNWHHQLIADTIDRVLSGELKNVVFNLPPGGSKTELVVINLIARGLALNPRARFLHLSGSDALASLNSATTREIITSDEYQKLWPLKIADDAKAKKRWNVEVDGQPAGGVYATSLGGQVTGFRAGHMAEGFQGAIIIDDPIKPEDAFSPAKINGANRRLLTTVKSRKANPDTPIILVMQRVGENDPSGFIEGGNVDGKWHFVKIPAVLDDAYVASLDPKYRRLIEPSEKVEGRFSYWPYKEPIGQLLTMEIGKGVDQNGGRISRYVFWSQYQQKPKTPGGNIIKGKGFTRYRVLPRMKQRKIFADTAQKTKERNDYSVFEEWGLGVDGLIYLLDLIRGKWEAPELQKRAIAFWAKAKARDSDQFGQLRKMVVEDKSSGTGLIQTIKLPPYNIPIEPIQRGVDKYTRVLDVLTYIDCGQVCVPEEAPFTTDFIAECEAFTADDSHDFDDQVDPMVDAINDMLQAGNKIKTWAALGKKPEGEKT
jgi:predicted phage terminase large subunit-like protein